MKFTNIIGHIDETDHEVKKVIADAQEKLSIAFTELSVGYDTCINSSVGGDPFIFQLIYPMPHICDLSAFYLDREKKKEEQEQKDKVDAGAITEEEAHSEEERKFRKAMRGHVLTTAATNGTRIYYNPVFINELSRMGVRIVLMHEALHGSLAHPNRRGHRKPGLWNIAIDVKVNHLILKDIRVRQEERNGRHSSTNNDYIKVFKDNLGDFIMLEEYAAFLRDPYNPPPKMAHFNPGDILKRQLDPAGYQDTKHPPLFYAEPNLEGDMLRPENIYDYLLSQIPRCGTCGKLGVYKKPEWYKELEKALREKEGDRNWHCHDHHTDNKVGQKCPDCCQECGPEDENEFDPSGGDLVDYHMDFDQSEEEYAKRLHEAAETARRMGPGRLAGSMQDELGELIKPKLSYTDFIRARLHKIREDKGRCDWNAPKSKPLTFGCFLPRRRTRYAKFIVLCDSSGSMSADDDIAFGISQLSAIDNHGEGTLMFFDTILYPETMVKLKSAKLDELRAKITTVSGRGGSSITQPLQEYPKHIKEPIDLLIVITDSFLIESVEEINKLLPQKTDIVWLTTRDNPGFRPRGRVFNLRRN